ncbi:MAG: hypothetical protein ACR2PX_15215 [Endozoicomonas sp.]|uniref:hypothetical protein n=1 Tax=Endozoicomonas sp. TaxID=1892382 RepID=UPI003D9B4B8B
MNSRIQDNDKYELVVNILEELGKAGGTQEVECSLEKLDERGWDIVLARGKNEVVYHHDQHRQMIHSGLPGLERAELDQRMVMDLLAALRLFLKNTSLMKEVVKEVCSVVPINIDSIIKEKMQSLGLQQGILELSLGLQQYIRLRGHPNVFAGTVMLSEKPRKHVEILLRGDFVEIRVSLEFSSLIIKGPDGQTRTLRMQLGIRNHYRLYIETLDLETSHSEVVLSPPQLPTPPSEAEQQAWLDSAQKMDEATVQAGLEKSRQSFERYRTEVEARQDDHLASLSGPSRQLKVAWQKLKSLRGLVEEWALNKDTLMDQYTQLRKATDTYLEKVRAALKEMGKTQADTHPLGQDMIDRYRRLAEQSIDHFEAMQQLAQQSQIAQKQREEQLRELAKQHEALGETFRYDTKSELPVARTARLKDGSMTQEQKAVTSYLVDIYYVMTSSFTVEKQMLLAETEGSSSIEPKSEDVPEAETVAESQPDEIHEPALPFRVIDDESRPETPDDTTPDNSQ